MGFDDRVIRGFARESLGARLAVLAVDGDPRSRCWRNKLVGEIERANGRDGGGRGRGRRQRAKSEPRARKEPKDHCQARATTPREGIERESRWSGKIEGQASARWEPRKDRPVALHG